MAEEEKEIGQKFDRWQGLVLFVAAQTFGGIWWASYVTLSLQVLKEKTVEIAANVSAATANRYTSQDATRDLAVLNDKISENKSRLADLDHRTIELERRFALKVQ